MTLGDMLSGYEESGIPPPTILSFTQKPGEVMELGGSFAKKAFRAKKIPSPRGAVTMLV
jgi:hypothetical protein